MSLRPRSRLAAPAPRLHRALHELTAAGLRGAPTAWRLAAALRRVPARAAWSPDGVRALDLHPHAADQRSAIELYQGLYERAERELVGRLVRPGDLCVDVGANFGIYTLLLACLVGPEGHVVACEPSPVVLDRIERLVRGLPCVELERVAIGARSERRRLVVAPGDSMHSSLRESRPPEGVDLAVDVRALDDLLPADVDVGFVKVDVEGFEAQVVAGMQRLLSSQRVRALLLEAQPAFGDVGWVREIAVRHGYRTYRLAVAPRGPRWSPRLEPLDPRDDQAVCGSIVALRKDFPLAMNGIRAARGPKT